MRAAQVALRFGHASEARTVSGTTNVPVDVLAAGAEGEAVTRELCI